MGQGCSGNIRDIASAAAEAAGQSNTVTQGSTNIIDNKKHSLWKQINNDRINELIENLSSEEFQTLLWIFRATCYSNRKTIKNTNITTTNNKSSSSTVHTVNNSWKRIFLCDNQLLQLFPSLHSTHITCILEGLSMSLQDTMINQTILIDECLLKKPLISSHRLMCAFQCSNYLYNARDTMLIDAVVKQIATTATMTGVNTTTATTSGSSGHSISQLHTALSTTTTTINNTHIHNNNTHTYTTTSTSTTKETPANELLFQDFYFTIALCRHGTLFEQLAFLFVLFAEPCDNIGNTAPVSVPISPIESLTTGTAPVSVPVPPTESLSSRATPSAGAADDCDIPEQPQSGAHPDSEVPYGEIELAGVNNNTEVVAVAGPTGQNSTVPTETLTPPAAVTGDAAVQQPPHPTTSSTTSAQPLPPPPLKTRMFSFSSSRTGTVPERTYLESRQLTETGAARLLLFLLLQRLKTLCPALSVVYSKVFSPVANMYVQSRPAWKLRQELLSIDWADNEALNTQEIQCILELRDLLALYGDLSGGCGSRSSAGRGLTYVDFMRVCLCSVSDVRLPTTTTTGGGGTTTAISMLQNGAGAWVSQNVRCSLQELVHDVLFSTVQLQRLAIAHYTTTITNRQLQCCMSVLGTPQPPPSKDRSEFDVFLLEAGWFLKWCKAMGVIPIFPTAQQKGLIYASVANTKKATKKKRSTTTSTIVDAVQCVQHLVIQLQPCLETQHSTTLPLGKLCLQNRQLVVQNSQGTWQLKPASLAQPYTQPYIPAEGSANIPHTTPTHHLLHSVDSEVVQYVLVPYTLGKVVYESCDPTAPSLPASTFRRTLRFASTARPIEDPTESMPVSDRPSSHSPGMGSEDRISPSPLSPGMGPGDRDALQSLGPTATQLVRNFQAHTVAVYDAYPLLLPLHLCTALGAATQEAVTVLNCSWRPSTHPYAPESCVLTTTHSSSSVSATVYAVTLQDVLMQVTKLVLSAEGAETVLGDSDLQQCCRLWGLFPAASTTNTTVRVQHSAEHEWRLLSSTAADYSAPFSQALGRPRRLMSARQNGHRNGRSTGAPRETACLGLMLEFSCHLLHSAPVPAPGLGVWPTDRVTWGQGVVPSTTTGQDGTLMCPYKIAEQVDVLTDRNQWQVGVVTNIHRDRDSGASHIAVRLLHDGETRHTPVVPVPRAAAPPVLCSSDSNDKHVSPQQSSVTTAEEHRHTHTDEEGVVVENGHTQDIHPVAAVGSGSERHAGNTALHRAYSGDSRDSDVESAVSTAEQEEAHTTAHTADAALVASVDSSAEYSDEGEGSDESELEDSSVQRPVRPATNTAASRQAEQQVHATTTDHIQQQSISADPTTVLSPNGVTYLSTTNTVQRGVIMLPFHSVRILKLGTMTGLSAVYGSFPHPTCSSSGSSAVVQCLLRQAQQFRQQAQEAGRWSSVAAPTVPLLPASAHLSRQSSLISEGSSVVGKSSLSAVPRSFLGRGSVAPLSSVEHLEDHHSVVSAGQVGDVTETLVTIKPDLSVSGWSVEELHQLRRFLQYTTECPLSLQALSALHYTELTLLHHNTSQSLPTGETYPDRSVAPDTTQYIPESSRSLTGTVPSSRPTVTVTASAGGGYRKQRNPFALCLKSVSKSIQHSLVPHPATSSVRRGSRGGAVTQTEARDTLRGLGDTAPGTRADGEIGTSESDYGTGAGTGAVIGDRVGGPGHTDPVFPHQQSYSGYSNRGAPSVGGAVGRANTTPISTWDSSSSSNSNSSGKATKTGIRIIGVAGLNNLGNTCFMSAALQCLLRTPLLVSYFQTSQYRTDLSARSVLGSKGRVTEEFAKVLRVLFALPSVPKKSLIPPAVALPPTLQHGSTTSSMHQQANGIVPDPSHASHTGTVCLPPQPAPSTVGRNIVYQNYSLTTLLRTFQTHKPQFSGADQQDAQEFFSELLDTFHEDLKVAPSTVPVVPPTPLPTPAATVPGATAASVVQDRLSVKDEGLHAAGNNPPVTMDGAGTSTSADLGAAAVAELNLPTTAERDSPTVAADPNMTVQQQGELRWQKYLSTNSSIISHLFQGQMCSKIVCKLCGTSSATFEPFTTLSMPIPRLRSMSLSPGSELTTVIITVHRKMPRLSQILRLPDEAFSNSVLTQSVFYDIYNATRQPIKLMLQFPRYASLEQVTTKAIQVYNGYEANCSVGYTGMGGSNSGSSTTETVTQHHRGASDTPMSRTGSQKQSSQSQLRTETENDAEVPMNSGQNGKSHRNNSTTATTTAGTTTSSSIPSIPPLVPINTIIIDVNDKQKGRFGKMLDKRDTLQALQDDTTGECHLQLQERCKDITFVASLQASRLSMEYERRNQEQLAQQLPRSLSCQYTSLLDYFDSAEYNPQHVLYNNSMESEGHLLADFDHTYDPCSYPALLTSRSGDSSVVLASHARRQSAENMHLSAQTDTSRGSSKLGGTAAKLAAQKLQEDTIAEQQRSTDYTYSNSKTWPSTLAQFQIGDRLDAVDYKGTWYPGSIIDILYLTEKDIKTHALSRYTRDFTGGRGTSSSTAPPLKQPCTAGLHLRVHFDGFKATWDEWYDQRDFDAGYLLPVYSKTSRKLKMHEIPVIQRRVSYVTSPVPIAEQQTGSTTDTVASLSIEILDTPSFIQAESYRSCAHLYHHLHEQLLRYVDVDQLMDTIVRPVGDQNMPFSIRLLSFDNLLIPPADHFCPVVTNSLSSKQEGQECCIGVSNTSTTTEISIADRFNGHKAWEGCAMPMDIARPVINIYHNKLAIGVDWFTPTTTTTTTTAASTSNSVSHSIVNSNTIPVLMHDRMLYRHDPSYTYYLQLQQQKAIAAAQVAAQKQHEQQLQENAVRAEVQSELADRDRPGGGGSGRAVVVQAEEQLMQQAYETDPRAGLTLEDVLSKFVRSEDIEEYHCSHCKRLTPGKLHFSVHTLPDILLLHLQRLVITSTGGGKIRTLVKFPLSRLDMQPFTTEQKERVAALADSTHPSDHTEQLLQQLGTADSSSSSSSKDMYDLYGVVNHIGGMHGGHYTAVSKVEEAVVQDIVSERCFGHTSCSAGGSSNNNSGSAVGTDKTGLHQGSQQQTTRTGDGLSLSELIASQWSHVSDTANGSSSVGFDSTTATTGATTTTADAWRGLSAQSSELPSPHSLKWMKFDDEFVNALPSTGLYNSVVTESAFLLFYKRKQLSEKNILKYL